MKNMTCKRNEMFAAVLAAGLLCCAVPAMAQEDAETAGTETGEPAVVFATTDLDGNPVTAEEIFSENKVTMVNLWGTFCGPCINEMPDLEVLNGRLADKGCAMIGIVCDVIDSADTARMARPRAAAGARRASWTRRAAEARRRRHRCW